MKTRRPLPVLLRAPAGSSRSLLADLRNLIHTARHHVAQTVDTGLVVLCWQMGRRIHRDILRQRRADYGEKIIQTLSGKLTGEFGAGYSRSNLANMVRFAEIFPDAQIIQTLSGKLGWSHFAQLLRVEDPLARDYYAEMCRLERWSVRTLQEKIASRLFLRTALSRKPARLARRELAALRQHDQVTPTSSSAIPMCWIFSACTTPMPRRIWRRPSCAKSRPSSWNSAPASLSSRGKSA